MRKIGLGFKEAENACCGSGPYKASPTCGGKRGVKEYSLCRHPEKFLFFDTYHPSERANKQSAQLMWNGSFECNQTSQPRSIVQIRACLNFSFSQNRK